MKGTRKFGTIQPKRNNGESFAKKQTILNTPSSLLANKEVRVDLDELMGKKNRIQGENKPNQASLPTDSVDLLKTQIKLYETQIAKLKDNEKKINKTLEETDSKILQLAKENSASKEVNSTILKQFNDLNAKYTSLLEDHTTIEQSYNDLQLIVTELRQELSKVSSENERLIQSTAESLTRKTEELNLAKQEADQIIRNIQNELVLEKEKNIALEKECKKQSTDIESKTRKLERLEEFVSISKAITTDIKAEKEVLIIKLQEEEERVRKLQAMVESSHEDSAQYEKKMNTMTEEYNTLKSEMNTIKKKLFHQLALSMKLDAFKSSLNVVNVHITDLWEQAKDISESEWYRFVNVALTARN